VKPTQASRSSAMVSRSNRQGARSFEMGIARIRDGKVVSYRDHFDRLQMTEQVGW
jgi:ketosteroid isomerase-like protein